MKERLQKILARAGISSRRKAEETILEGRVSINGQIVFELGTKADPAQDVIELDGMEIASAENKVYLMLNKPPGFITSVEDPQGRPTIMSLVSGIPERVVPVGRLDYDTEGLLIMTNDGDFSQLLQHPRFQIERCYRVKVKGVPTLQAIEKLKAGVYIDNKKTNKCMIKLLQRLDKNAWLEVRLKEGRNRQIRRMFESVGHDVIRIIRTGFGPLQLEDLPVGAFRFLKKPEIETIKDLEKNQPPKPTRKPMRKPAGKQDKVSGKPLGWAVSKNQDRKAVKQDRTASMPQGAKAEKPQSFRAAGLYQEKTQTSRSAGAYQGAKAGKPQSSRTAGLYQEKSQSSRSAGTYQGARAGKPQAPRSTGTYKSAKAGKPGGTGSGKPQGRPGKPFSKH